MFLFFFQLFWTPAESCSSSLKPKGIQRYLSLSCSLSPWSFSLFKPYNDKSLLFYFPSTQNDFFSFPKLILLINKADNLSACFGTERFIFTKNGKRGKKENWDRKVEKKKKKLHSYEGINILKSSWLKYQSCINAWMILCKLNWIRIDKLRNKNTKFYSNK